MSNIYEYKKVTKSNDDYTSILNELNSSSIYEQGENILTEKYDKVKERMKEKLQAIPDLPIGKILFLAPIIKEKSDFLFNYISDGNNISGAINTDEYWDMEYLIDKYMDNVSVILKDNSIEETGIPSNFDNTALDLLKDLSNTMDNVVSSYGNNEVFEKYLNHIYSLSMALSLALI